MSEQMEQDSGPERWTKRVPAWIEEHWKLALTLFGTVIAILGFLFGSGVYLRPRLTVTCTAVSLGIPPSQKMELMMFRMQMMAPEFQNDIASEMGKGLRSYGMREERIRAIIKDVLATENMSKTTTPSQRLATTRAEDLQVQAALSKAMGSLVTTMGEWFRIPDGVLFFQVRNSGNRSAHNVHVVVRMKTTPYDVRVDTDNRFTKKIDDTQNVVVDLDAVAPDSTTDGLVYYMSSGSVPKETPLISKDEISVSYEYGTIRKEFSEETFVVP
jgi:hypothetical protein